MEFIIEVPKILSFNNYLKAGIKKGRSGSYAYLYMDSDVRKYKEYIKSFVINNYKEYILGSELFNPTNKFYIEWNYEVTNPDKIDVSNINKIIEDSIFDGINEVIAPVKINDVQVVKCSMTKGACKVLGTEVISCKISLYVSDTKSIIE